MFIEWKKKLLNCPHYVITAEVYVAQFIKTLRKLWINVMKFLYFFLILRWIAIYYHIYGAFVNGFIVILLFLSALWIVYTVIYFVAIELDNAHCCILFFKFKDLVSRVYFVKKLIHMGMTSFSPCPVIVFLRCKYF